MDERQGELDFGAGGPGLTEEEIEAALPPGWALAGRALYRIATRGPPSSKSGSRSLNELGSLSSTSGSAASGSVQSRLAFG
jgi:hypothetical protein